MFNITAHVLSYDIQFKKMMDAMCYPMFCWSLNALLYFVALSDLPLSRLITVSNFEIQVTVWSK